MTFSVTGIEEATKLLSEATYKAKVKLFLEKLAELGMEVAVREYGSLGYDGNKKPVVHWDSLGDNEVCVIATGPDVLFLEFGTGITYAEPYPQDEGFEPTFKAGDWSDNEALGGKHHWKQPWGWYYYPKGGGNAIRTHGQPPTRAMYEAKKQMQLNIEKIIKEVFT